MKEILNRKIETQPNLSKRILAGVIDYAIIFGYCFIISYFFGEPNNEGGTSVKGFPGFTIIIFWSIWTIGAEQYFGRTFGNYTQNLTVISLKNSLEKLTIGQSIKRHLVDMFDFWPFGILGILFIKNTKYNQRLGDLWAKTIVIDTTDKTQGIMFE